MKRLPSWTSQQVVHFVELKGYCREISWHCRDFSTGVHLERSRIIVYRDIHVLSVLGCDDRMQVDSGELGRFCFAGTTDLSKMSFLSAMIAEGRTGWAL